MACLSAQCLTPTTTREMSECTQLFVLSETSKRGGISWPVDLATTCFHLDFKTVRDGRVRNTLGFKIRYREQIPLKFGLKMMALPLPSSLNSKSCTDLSKFLDDLVESSSVFTKLMTINKIQATLQKILKQPKSAIQKQTRSCEINIYK